MYHLFIPFLAILPIQSQPMLETASQNKQERVSLPFDQKTDFEDANRGFIAPLLANGIVKNNKGEIIWDLSAYRFLDADKVPSSVNPSLWRQAKLLHSSGLFKVTDRIYQVRGQDISNMTIIEGDTGIIVVDPLLSKETAKAALELYYQNRPKKPIKAVLYTHSHADHFGGVKGVISEEDVTTGKVKVIAPEGFTKAALDENIMAGNVMGRRAMYMYGSLLKPGETGQVSAGLGLQTSLGELTLILPTEYVTKTGQEMDIDGVKFVFLMAKDSEAPAEMLFFLPELKALGSAEDATHTMHNLYTLRGAKIRDAKAWASYLNQAIELFGPQTEVVFAQHHWPKWGNQNVIDFLEKQRDLYKYIHDQTLHLANQGYNMTEIGEKIKLPDSLANVWYNRGYYGSLNHNAKAVYNFYLGWFSGNPSTLHPLPEKEGSKKYVEYMGGIDNIIEKAKDDYAKGNYRWVAEVLNHVVFADPSNTKAKDLLAKTLDQLGYQSENATWRNFYLSGAQDLRGTTPIKPNLTPANPDMIAAMPITNFFDYHSILLDGPKAALMPMSVNFNLKDTNEKYLVEIKNGVLNYYPGKNADKSNLTITLSRNDLNTLILDQSKLIDYLNSGKVSIQGDRALVFKWLSLFDRFDPGFSLIEPIK